MKGKPLDQRFIPEPSQYDSFFKALITAGWNVKSGGSVDSSTGFFALVEVPSHAGERNEMRDAVFGDEEFSDQEWSALSSWPKPAWYVTTENELGQIYAYGFQIQGNAESIYSSLEKEYDLWAESLEIG